MTGRSILQIVEIDVDTCENTFGVSPCTASAATGGECYNTYFTCQDVPNYVAGTTTLRFSENIRTGIFGTTIFPALQSVSTNPTRISMGLTDDKLGSLGRRARITVQLKDFKWWDRGTDPYVATRTYDPRQGTFFGKLHARWPYYYGRALRVKTGYVGDALGDLRTRNYIITEWSGPDSNGNVTITAQDPIRLADDELSQCPVLSEGDLAADLSAVGTSFSLVPSGVGDDYDAAGYVAIGSEIIKYTRSGDNFTVELRGAGGTTAASHSAGDAVQLCYSVESARPDAVLADLLENYAGVPAAILPTTDWATEVTTWLGSTRLTRIVPKPTPVRTLIGEITAIGMFLWHDEIANEIKLRINRPPGYGVTVPTINDASHILESTTTREDVNDQRLSRVIVRYGLLNQFGSTTDVENYPRRAKDIDLGKESANEYAQQRILDVFLPWLEVDDAVARAIAIRTLNRFRDTPVRATFDADIKDNGDLGVADLINLDSATGQDVTGASAPLPMQITSREETIPGHRLRLTAQKFEFEGRFGFITENSRGDYGSSSAAEISNGTYIVDESTLLFPDGTGPYLIF